MSWVEKNRKINNRVGTILRDSRVVIRNKFTYLIESTCKKNETYNLNSVYLNVLVLFIICTPFRVAPRIEKTEVFKKVDILQAVLFLQVASWKKIFLLWRKEKAFFFLILTMELSSTVLSYLNAHSTLKFAGTFFYVWTTETSKEQDLKFIRSCHLFLDQPCRGGLEVSCYALQLYGRFWGFWSRLSYLF